MIRFVSGNTGQTPSNSAPVREGAIQQGRGAAGSRINVPPAGKGEARQCDAYCQARRMIPNHPDPSSLLEGLQDKNPELNGAMRQRLQQQLGRGQVDRTNRDE